MDHDLVIVGAGPAGLSAAIYAGRADLNVVLLEKALVGGQVAMTMDIANYPGFPDGIDGPTLSDNMRKQAERFGAKFITADCSAVEIIDGGFKLTTSEGEKTSKTVIIATGADPRPLGVPGETELRGRGVSYCGTCDAPFFRDKKVTVIGGGDTALKEGLHIAKFAAEVIIVHRRDQFRAEKIYWHQVDENEKINVKWDTILTKVNGDKSVTSLTLKNVKTKDEEEFVTDGVFIFVGTLPNTAPFADILKIKSGEHVVTDKDMMTSAKGLYAVGDVRADSYRQVATAVGEGSTAAMAIDHYLMENK